MSEPMMWLLVRGVWETLAMTFVSGFFGFVIGLPVGVLLYVTRPGQIIANAKLYRTVSAIVNIFRSIPFIILLVWMIPFTRVIVGTSIGLQAAIVPLTVGAAPFIARMVENALLEIPTGLIEASRAMGATPMQIVRKVLLPEALPGLVNAATITLITLVGYSAMGGRCSDVNSHAQDIRHAHSSNTKKQSQNIRTLSDISALLLFCAAHPIVRLFFHGYFKRNRRPVFI